MHCGYFVLLHHNQIFWWFWGIFIDGAHLPSLNNACGNEYSMPEIHFQTRKPLLEFCSWSIESPTCCFLSCKRVTGFLSKHGVNCDRVFCVGQKTLQFDVCWAFSNFHLWMKQRDGSSYINQGSSIKRGEGRPYSPRESPYLFSQFWVLESLLCKAK